jgi:hypothetical protein
MKQSNLKQKLCKDVSQEDKHSGIMKREAGRACSLFRDGENLHSRKTMGFAEFMLQLALS